MLIGSILWENGLFGFFLDGFQFSTGTMDHAKFSHHIKSGHSNKFRLPWQPENVSFRKESHVEWSRGTEVKYVKILGWSTTNGAG